MTPTTTVSGNAHHEKNKNDPIGEPSKGKKGRTSTVKGLPASGLKKKKKPKLKKVFHKSLRLTREHDRGETHCQWRGKDWRQRGGSTKCLTTRRLGIHSRVEKKTRGQRGTEVR